MAKLGYTQVKGHLEAERDLKVGKSSGDGLTIKIDSEGIKFIPREAGVDDNSKELFYDTVNNRWAVETSLYVEGSAVLTTADEGSGNGIDSDTLDGQEGTHYLDLSNATGTLADARLSGTYTIDISGDAGTLDGLNASQFIRSDSNDITSGSITIQRNSSEMLVLDRTSDNNATIRFKSTTKDAYLGVLANGQLAVGNSADVIGSGVRLLTTADEGSGNGIDSDTLDGQEGSWYQDLANATGTLADARLSGTYTIDISGDAGTLDGINSTQFVRTDIASTITQQLSIGVANNSTAFQLKDDGTTNNALRSGFVTNGTRFYTAPVYNNTPDFTKEFGYNYTDNRWYFETDVYVNGNKILTTADEGSGNGIDSDTLDGQQGTHYLDLANATGTLADARLSGTYTIDISGDAGTVDGLNASQFIRSDADDTFTGQLTSAISKGIKFPATGNTGWEVYGDTSGKLTFTINGTSGAEMQLDADGSDYTTAVLRIANQAVVTGDRLLTAGTGLSGGGNLNADRTFNIDYSSLSTTTLVGGDNIAFSDTSDSNNIKKITIDNLISNMNILTTADEGSGNGIDSDTLDGQEGAWYQDLANATGNLDLGSGTLTGNYIQANNTLSYLNTTNVVIGGNTRLDLAATSVDDITIGSGAWSLGLIIYSTGIGAIGFGDSQFDTINKIQYSHGTNDFGFWAAGTQVGQIDSSGIFVPETNGPKLLGEDSSATNPTLIPDRADDNTGIGHAGSDELSLVAGGNETIRVTSTGATLNGKDIATIDDIIALAIALG